MSDDLARARARFVQINGEHPMTPDDDAYVREHFVAADEESLRLMALDVLPQAAYVLGDGTPMVPPQHRDPLAWAGGPDRVRAWFLAHWPDDEQEAAGHELADWLDGQHVCLRQQEPVPIRLKDRFAAQLVHATEALERDPGDHLARGALGEAVSRLEQLMLPQTAYDDLRFGGGTSTWDRVRHARELLRTSPPPLPIRTERLLLRAVGPEDAAAMADYLGRPDVATHLLEPPQRRYDVEHSLRRRTQVDDALFVVVEHEGRVVGDLMLDLKGPDRSQAEIGWVMHPDVAGRGMATEASRALLDLAFDHYRVHRVFAVLDARNRPSAALAQRLGMRLETHARSDYWSKGEWTDSQTWAVVRADRDPPTDEASAARSH